MRPLTVLIGIVMGSTVSLAVGLLLTLVVFLFLPDDTGLLAAEWRPLLKAVALFSLVSAAAAGSFYGELRDRRWRFPAHLLTVALLSAAVWTYWPE